MGTCQQSGQLAALGASGKEVAEDHGPQGGQGPSTEPGNAHGVAEVVEAAEDGVGSPDAVWVGGLAGAGTGAGHHGALIERELCLHRHQRGLAGYFIRLAVGNVLAQRKGRGLLTGDAT